MPKSSSASSEAALASNMPNLKQRTLSFASAKRTNSTSNTKSQQRTTVTEKKTGERIEPPVEAQNNVRSVEIFEISDEEGGATAEIAVPVKRTRATTKVQTSFGTTKPAPTQPLQCKKKDFPPERIGKEHLDVEDIGGRYHKYYNEVRSKMGHMEPSKRTTHGQCRGFHSVYI